MCMINVFDTLLFSKVLLRNHVIISCHLSAKLWCMEHTVCRAIDMILKFIFYENIPSSPNFHSEKFQWLLSKDT